jgi:tRNA nucleotidyltransferase (CCA-adding enzyme)
MMRDPVIEGLQVYVVGGAVRDALLQRTAGDHDWVVVGTSPEEMVRRGFIPVGGDFPVFLHPQTKEEYALARTERKSGRGYKGFTFYTGCDVTLEEDLKRRDLTVNAIAQSVTGELFDPLGGVKDIHARILRHVGPAFEEDPVRILRLARFTARFVDFSIAPETLELCKKMVALGEVDALVPERVWQELSRGLMCEKPSRMIHVLVACGASARVLPGWVSTQQVCDAIDRAAQLDLPLACRFALLCLATPDPQVLSKHLRAPTECSDMSRLLPVVLTAVNAAVQMPEEVLALFEQCDAIRKPERFMTLLHAAQVVTAVSITHLQHWLDAVLSIDAGAAARSAPSPQQIKAVVRAARLQALSQAFKDCRAGRRV